MFLLILLLLLTSTVYAEAQPMNESVVVITADPAASEVYINGELKGRHTPLAISLPPGLYQLIIKDDAGNTVEEPLLVGITNYQATLTEKETYSEKTTGLEFTLIKKGCFEIGSPSSESGRDSDESQRNICLEQNFYMSTTEVTFAAYDIFAEATGRELPKDEGWGRGDRPVINVSWQDAVAFAEWLSQKTGKTYRLPTEAEWEYAARAGTTTRFWWGSENPVCRNARNGAQYTNCTLKKTLPVQTFSANPWGLYDVHGNVAEWTASCYVANYDGSEQKSASKKATCKRVVRGGAWDWVAHVLRSAQRWRRLADKRYSYYGFRLARDVN